MTSSNVSVHSSGRCRAEPVCSQRWKVNQDTLKPQRTSRPQRANLMARARLGSGWLWPDAELRRRLTAHPFYVLDD